MELSEKTVEEWLKQNREIAKKIFKRNVFDAEQEIPLKCQTQNSVLKLDNEPPQEANLYQSFFEIAKLLNSCLDVKLIVHYVLKTACSLLKAEKCSLFLLDKEKKELYTIAFDVDKEGTSGKEIRVPVGVGIVGIVAKNKQGMNIPDVYKEPLFNPKIDAETGFRTKNMLCLPIMESRERDPELVGVACLVNKNDKNDSTVLFCSC
jgi:putative methionine-R-sulfoxide reductase with GAF domain